MQNHHFYASMYSYFIPCVHWEGLEANSFESSSFVLFFCPWISNRIVEMAIWPTLNYLVQSTRTP